MKLPLGPHRKVWSSLADSTAWMAMMLSPPGRLSITTGLPQRSDNFSWIRRAPMSAPAPGPNGMMNFTGRCGQLSACARVEMKAGAARSATAKARRRVNCMNVPPRAVSKSDGSWCVRPAQCSGLRLLFACLMDRRDLGTLLLDGGGEFFRGAGARRRADASYARAERRIGDECAGIGRNARLDFRRRVARAVDAGDAVEGEVAIARLGRGRHLGCLRRALAVGHEQQPRGAGAVMRHHGRQAGAD